MHKAEQIGSNNTVYQTAVRSPIGTVASPNVSFENDQLAQEVLKKLKIAHLMDIWTDRMQKVEFHIFFDCF